MQSLQEASLELKIATAAMAAVMVECIADGIMSVLSRTRFMQNPWTRWDRPLTRPWIYFS